MKNLNHIVIIDDNKIDCFINHKIISNSFSISTSKIFNNSVEALDFFNDTKSEHKILPLFCPDLILLDINMPIMNGFDFLKELAKTSLFLKKPIDVYFLSSSKNEKDVSKAREAKFSSGYIVKPLTKDKILKAIEINQNNESFKMII